MIEWNKIKSSEWPWALLSAMLCMAISYPYIGTYYFHANQHMTAFGGDAYVIMYDVAYHTKFGSGTTLSNMNYPEGEYIFLTDAEGALSTLLSWMNHHLFKIEDYSVGIVQGLNAWLIPVGGAIMYYLLRSFEVSRILSIVTSGLVILLAPSFLRLGGHYGLAYPFFLPLFMLWFIRKHRVNMAEWRDILILVILLFFTFNNPYVGFGACFFLLAASFMKLVLERKISTSILLTAGLAILNLAIVFLTFKLNDPYHDRIKLQWGFYPFRATLEGYIAPTNSLVDHFLIRNFGKGFYTQFESCQNVGAVVVLTYIAWLIISIMRKRKKMGISFPSNFLPVFWGASLILIYASAILFMAFKQEWVEEKLGFLLMFKASGRIAWVFYYAASIGAIILIDRFLRQINFNWIKYVLILFIASLWLYEIQVYMGPYFENTVHDTIFSKSKLEEHANYLKDHHINTEDYQAILQLPKSMFWSDKFRGEMNWSSQYHSFRTSMATGLPLVNSFLSRVALNTSAEAIELISDPHIEKSMPLKFLNDKDLLIVLGNNSTLSLGEQYLLDVSEKLLDTLKYSYYRLPIARINEMAIQSRSLFANDTLEMCKPFVHFTFDNEPSEHTYFGGGAHKVDQRLEVLLDTVIQDTFLFYDFSVWTHLDSYKYSCGDWIFDIWDQNGLNAFHKIVQTMESPDVQDDWIRTMQFIRIEKGMRLKIAMSTNQDFIIDELLITPQGKNYLHDAQNESRFLWNGIRIKKPE